MSRIRRDQTGGAPRREQFLEAALGDREIVHDQRGAVLEEMGQRWQGVLQGDRRRFGLHREDER